MKTLNLVNSDCSFCLITFILLSFNPSLKFFLLLRQKGFFFTWHVSASTVALLRVLPSHGCDVSCQLVFLDVAGADFSLWWLFEPFNITGSKEKLRLVLPEVRFLVREWTLDSQSCWMCEVSRMLIVKCLWWASVLCLHDENLLDD